MTAKKIYANDYGYNLNFTLKDGNGDAVDLTNATSVTFKMLKKDGTAVKVSGTCVINTPKTLGTCYYVVQAGDFDEVGEFQYQIQITESASVVTCEPQETINVLRRF